jgi:LysR family glycine cleavage system transcriptional activator
MRRLPSFSALRGFEAAARLGSFSLACKELHLTPSAISHEVRSLEDYFGRPLFIRRNRCNQLTQEGRRLLVGLSPAFDAIEVACAELTPGPKRKTLAVHCSPSFASQWLGPSLPDFVKRNPSVAIRLTSSAEPANLFGSEGIDAVISYGSAMDSPGLVSESLGAEEVVAVCSPDIAARFDPSDPLSLAALPLIESTVSPVRWSDWFVANGMAGSPLKAGIAFDRGALAIAAARQGMGVTLEARRFAREDLATGKLVLLGGTPFMSIMRELHFLAYRAGPKNAAIITPFRDWLFQRLADEASRSSWESSGSAIGRSRDAGRCSFFSRIASAGATADAKP